MACINLRLAPHVPCHRSWDVSDLGCATTSGRMVGPLEGATATCWKVSRLMLGVGATGRTSPHTRCSSKSSGTFSGEYLVKFCSRSRIRSSGHVWRRSVKPSAQPTLVRTQHLPPPAKTARLLRKRGPAGRFLLVTTCIRVCHYGSIHGSVRVHMVYSARAKLAVRITARSRDLAAVRGGRGTSQYASRRADSGLQICQGGTKASSCPGGLLAADWTAARSPPGPPGTAGPRSACSPMPSRRGRRLPARRGQQRPRARTDPRHRT